MEKYLDITKPRYSEHFLPVPWFCYLRLYFGVDIFPVVCSNGLQGLKMD